MGTLDAATLAESLRYTPGHRCPVWHADLREDWFTLRPRYLANLSYHLVGYTVMRTWPCMTTAFGARCRLSIEACLK